MQYGETLWLPDFFSENYLKQGSISFNSIANQKSKCSENKIKVNCRSIFLENENNQAYKWEKKTFTLNFMTRWKIDDMSKDCRYLGYQLYLLDIKATMW